MTPSRISRITFLSFEKFKINTGFVNAPPHELIAALGVIINNALGVRGMPNAHKLIIGGP